MPHDLMCGADLGKQSFTEKRTSCDSSLQVLSGPIRTALSPPKVQSYRLERQLVLLAQKEIGITLKYLSRHHVVVEVAGASALDDLVVVTSLTLPAAQSSGHVPAFPAPRRESGAGLFRLALQIIPAIDDSRSFHCRFTFFEAMDCPCGF
jgi:hypothetical protein